MRPEVTNTGSDRSHLEKMATQAKATPAAEAPQHRTANGTRVEKQKRKATEIKAVHLNDRSCGSGEAVRLTNVSGAVFTGRTIGQHLELVWKFESAMSMLTMKNGATIEMKASDA